MREQLGFEANLVHEITGCVERPWVLAYAMTMAKAVRDLGRGKWGLVDQRGNGSQERIVVEHSRDAGACNSQGFILATLCGFLQRNRRSRGPSFLRVSRIFSSGSIISFSKRKDENSITPNTITRSYFHCECRVVFFLPLFQLTGISLPEYFFILCTTITISIFFIMGRGERVCLW